MVYINRHSHIKVVEQTQQFHEIEHAYIEDVSVIVLSDTFLSLCDSGTSVKAFINKHPDIRMLLLLGREDLTVVAERAKQGVTGFLHKHFIKHLPLAIETLREKGSYLSEALAKKLARYIQEKTEENLLTKLTKTEKRIFSLLRKGYTEKEIARSENRAPGPYTAIT